MLARFTATSLFVVASLPGSANAQEPVKPLVPRWRSAAQTSEKGWVIQLEGERLLICGAKSCAWLEAGDPRWRRGESGVEIEELAIAELLASAGQAAVAKPALAAGDLIPGLILVDLDDRPIRLGAYRGKRLLITAWASW